MNLNYEGRRADRAGVTLEEWLAAKAAKKAATQAAATRKAAHEDPIEELVSLMEAHPDQIFFTVRHGSGSVHGGVFPYELHRVIGHCNSVASTVGADPRAQAISWLIDAVRSNAHMSQPDGKAAVMTAAWLALTAPDWQGVPVKAGQGFFLDLRREAGIDYLRVVGIDVTHAPQEGIDGAAHDVAAHYRCGHWRQLRNGNQVWVREAHITEHIRHRSKAA